VAADPLVSLLADLVAIPSQNPMGRDKTGAEYSEAAMADFVAGYLKRHGVDAERYDIAPGRPNVIGYLDAGAQETLLFEAHMDTVHAEGMTIPPFVPEIRNGRLYGRGACDTKGSLAAFLYAVCGAGTPVRGRRYNVILAAVADEEYQFGGAQRVVARGVRASMAIVGEPTQLHIVRAHKGVVRWRIGTSGVTAHSAYPERGSNAIYAMGHVLERLELYASALREIPPHPLLGSPSLSVGIIEGGQAVNVVPDRCMIEIDRRTLPGETTDSVLAHVRDALRGIDGWTFDPPHLAASGLDIAPDHPLITNLSAAIRKETGTAVVEAAQYATDAGVYARGGIPAVVFGPGNIAQAHTKDEWIDLAELAQASRIVQTMIA
jgi:acetylornithine deacetylase/succinyl-diaminopimelate desuccinylase family protein